MFALYGWALTPDLGGGAPAALLERRVAGGLLFAAGPAGQRRFDPAEAVNHVVAAGISGAEPTWRDRFVATGQAMARSLDATPRRFRVRFERWFDLRPLVGRGRVRLRLPRPIEDGALGNLALAIDAPDGVVIVERPGRIELRLAGPPPDLAVGWTAAFTSRPANFPSCSDDADYLAEREGLIQVTPRVRALAAELAGGLTDERAILAFRNHLLDRFACGIVAYEAIAGPATDHVLRTGWYDCQLGAALLVALCRARGISARMVGGYLLWPAAPSRHVWCEIRLSGGEWRPFDLLAWDLSAGGRDRPWRDAFAGHIDHRMKTEILPNVFAGAMSLPFPTAHHRLLRREGGGIAIDHRGVADGATIYRDTISVLPDAA